MYKDYILTCSVSQSLSLFVTYLIALFSSTLCARHLSGVQTSSKESDSAELGEVDRRLVVLEWKFSQLDANSDTLVDTKELDRLGRLVKKLVKPASCATSFYTRCDLDGDFALSPTEWKSCFDADGGAALEFSQPAVDGT